MPKIVELGLLREISDASRKKPGRKTDGGLTSIAHRLGYSVVSKIVDVPTVSKTIQEERWERNLKIERRDRFIAAAITGIIAAPETFKTGDHGASITENAIAIADRVIARITENDAAIDAAIKGE